MSNPHLRLVATYTFEVVSRFDENVKATALLKRYVHDLEDVSYFSAEDLGEAGGATIKTSYPAFHNNNEEPSDVTPIVVGEYSGTDYGTAYSTTELHRLPDCGALVTVTKSSTDVYNQEPINAHVTINSIVQK